MEQVFAVLTAWLGGEQIIKKIKNKCYACGGPLKYQDNVTWHGYVCQKIDNLDDSDDLKDYCGGVTIMIPKYRDLPELEKDHWTNEDKTEILNLENRSIKNEKYTTTKDY